MELSSQLVNKTIRTLGNFIWLGNNIHNIFTPEFKQMFLNAVKDARIVYDELESKNLE